MKTLLRLSSLIAPLLPAMALAVALGTAGNLCAIGIPVLGVSLLAADGPLPALVILGVCRGALHYAEQYCNHYIAFTILARIRGIVFRKLRELGPSALEGRQKGGLMALATSDIELLEVFYAHTVSPVCIAALVAAAMCAFFAQKNALLVIPALLSYGAVGVAVPALSGKKAAAAAERYRAESAGMNSLLLDSLRGIRQTIAYGRGESRLRMLELRSDALSESQRKMNGAAGLAAAASGVIVTAAAALMLLCSLALFRRGMISFGDVLVCTAAMFSSFGPMIAVANLGAGLSQTVAAGGRLLSLLDEKPAAADVDDGEDVLFAGADCADVRFRYGADEEYVLDGVSLAVPPGKIIGISGRSGSGKSTLLRLFMRFWDAASGSVRISETDVKKINTECLRGIESYVTQETVLFHDTIENNIRIAKLDASEDEIREACRKAAIIGLIERLPDGFKTQVAELGDNFSGGERQRIGLARSFLHGGEFLLLDEPTSNVDSFNEREILSSVKAAADGRTVVIVSHRASTLEIADVLYKIESGRNS